MLLLASASPARRRLLEQAAIPHRVQVSGVDEALITADDPGELVGMLAQAKAQAVVDQLQPGPITAVLGCDSLLVVQGEVFGKPANPAEAIARWQRMAGGWGELHTGHCLVRLAGAGVPGPASGSLQLPTVPSRENITALETVTIRESVMTCETVTTRVQFADLSLREIEAYVATGEPLQCAGGFALEGVGGQVVERIEGCFSNVIGLSLPLLRRWLSA